MNENNLTDNPQARPAPILTLAELESALRKLRAAKPSDRSELARRYAVTITEMEKVVAYFKMYAVEQDE